MTNKHITTTILLTGIFILINVLANRFFLRLDLTESRQYTLSKATRALLADIKEPVTVTAYFSDNLPPQFAAIRRDFQDLLIEYGSRSHGYVNYEFISPETEDQKQAALQAGIQPLLINVSEKDQVKQQQAFMGAVLHLGEQQDVIPFISGQAMEYSLSRSIKKIAATDKPAIGLVQGHGEPPLSQLGPVYDELSVLYAVENVDLSAEPTIADRFRAVAIVAPKDSFPPDQLAKLDDYLRRGGKLCIALNRVNGDLQNAQGTVVNTGLEGWLAGKGLDVPAEFLLDEQCENVTVQQRQGFFTIASPKPFPYLPVITEFADHPITQGLEQIVLPFASPVEYRGDSTLHFTPLAFTSIHTGTEAAPTYFDIFNRQWTLADFPKQHLPIAGVLEGPIAGTAPSTIVLFGDGDFPMTAQSPDNVSLFVNTIDWLSDDTGLIALRTKGVAARPIDQEYLSEDGEGRRAFLKYFNFGLPILLVILLGIFFSQRQQQKRRRRAQEHFA